MFVNVFEAFYRTCGVHCRTEMTRSAHGPHCLDGRSNCFRKADRRTLWWLTDEKGHLCPPGRWRTSLAI